MRCRHIDSKPRYMHMQLIPDLPDKAVSLIEQAKKDLDIREVAQCSCLRLRRITRLVTQVYDRVMEPAGLTVGQFGLLARLYGAKARREVVPIGILAERMGMDPTTLSRNLKPLEYRDFIDSSIKLEDRRQRAVRITEAGITKLRHAVPLWRRAQRQIDDALGIDASVALNGLLELSYDRLSNTNAGRD
jgi:DNA-binding MarR family transcriptional regulator